MATDRIAIDVKNDNQLLVQLRTSGKRLTRTIRLAANTTMRQANTRIRRGLAGELDIAQKHLKNRIRYRAATSLASTAKTVTVREASQASIWIGLNPIAARQFYWGRLQQDTRGAWAKKYFFEGAFVATLSSRKGPSIYKRLGKPRFPVQQQVVEADTPATRRVIGRVVDQAQEKFLDEVSRLARVDWSKARRRTR